ncbi:MAG: D-alanyl-D-alanine carboxypeptidase family protein [Pseudomonadota bacterium]
MVFRWLLGFFAAACLSFAPASAQPAVLPDTLATIDAPVVYLVDASNGQVLFERGGDRRFVPASVTKVMTLFTAFELMDAGQLAPHHLLRVSPEAWKEWRGKGSTMFLNADDRVPLSDLLTGIANVSANDASYVLAENVDGSIDAWSARMNAKARGLGMAQSHFATPNGWPDEGRTFTTARDLVTVATALLENHSNKVARYIGKRQFTYGGITQSNYDPMLGRLEGADGIKTGYTNEAGFNYLGTAKRGDQRLFVVVAGADRQPDRARLARGLVEWGFSAFDQKPLFGKGDTVSEAQVQNGRARSVELVADRDILLNVPKGQGNGITMTIRYDGPLRAPVASGERVATLVIEAPDVAPAKVPMFAKSSVAEAGLLARIVNAVAGWLS